MVQDEADVGQLAYGPYGGGQLVGPHEQVVHETRRADRLDTAADLGTVRPVRAGLVLDAVPDADERGAARPLAQFRESVGDTGIGQARPADDRPDVRVPRRQGEQFRCLVRYGDGLDDDGGVDGVPVERGAQFGGGEGPAQGGHVAGPRLVTHSEVPQMVMSVDAHRSLILRVGGVRMADGRWMGERRNGGEGARPQSRWKISSAEAHHSPSATPSSGCWHGSVSAHHSRDTGSAAIAAVSAA